MKYDCFTFFNELDLLEIRLNVLGNEVDKFVIVEASKTQKNENKKLYFKENKARYKHFEHKIIHIIVDDYPTEINKWTIENHQRNCIARGLTECKPDDIIIISDLDEIPNPNLINKIQKPNGIIAFDLNYFKFYLNNFSFGEPWEHGPKMLTYKNFKTILDNVPCSHGALDSSVNLGTTASKIRLYEGANQLHIQNAGWHFAWMGGAEALIKKLDATCEGGKGLTFIQAQKALKIKKNHLGYNYIPVKIDESYPEYVKINYKKFENLTIKNTKINAKFIIILHNTYLKASKIKRRILKNFSKEKINRLIKKFQLVD